MNDRQTLIVQIVSEKGRISVNDLSKETGVSVVTIRHDLTVLEKAKYIRREHGFAVMEQEHEDTESRSLVNFSVKQALARQAAQLVNKNDTVFIEGGSTNAFLARLLASRADITIITMSVYIAHLLKDSDCSVILLGGMLQKPNEGLVGPITRAALQMVNFNKTFIGVDGYTSETGFTGRDMMRADILNTAIDKCACNVVLTDSSKFGRVYLNAFGPMDKIHYLITDSDLNEKYRQLLEDKLTLLSVNSISKTRP